MPDIQLSHVGIPELFQRYHAGDLVRVRFIDVVMTDLNSSIPMSYAQWLKGESDVDSIIAMVVDDGWLMGVYQIMGDGVMFSVLSKGMTLIASVQVL